MYSLIKDYFISDIANLILINYYKLDQIDFQADYAQAMLLYKTRVYNYRTEFIDSGLTNIRAIAYEADSYFAISYDNDLYVWGNNTYGNLIVDAKSVESPTLALKSVKSIYCDYFWTAVINCNDELNFYGKYHDVNSIMASVKAVIRSGNKIYTLKCDNSIIGLNTNYHKDNIKHFVNQMLMITTDDQLICQDKILKNVEQVKIINSNLYILTTDRILLRTNNRLEFDEVLETNVKNYNGDDDLFVKADKRIIYSYNERHEVNYDVIFAMGSRVTIEHEKLTFYGTLFNGKLIFLKR